MSDREEEFFKILEKKYREIDMEEDDGVEVSDDSYVEELPERQLSKKEEIKFFETFLKFK